MKIPWSGVLTSVQPRIRLTHSFDQLSHTYQGYVLRVQGTIGEDQRGFIVAIGAGAHAKHQLQVGDSVSGLGIAVADPRLETAELVQSKYSNTPFYRDLRPPPCTRLLLILDLSKADNQGQFRQTWGGNTKWTGQRY